MSFVDPTPHRVSSCPVHFIWDGKGRGRSFVRAGFLGCLVAAALAAIATYIHVDVVRQIGLGLGLASIASWLVGHALGTKLLNPARAAPPR